MGLRKVQNKSLFVSAAVGGLLGFIGVGEGKTLLCALLPTMLKMYYGIDPRDCVLLIPPSMRRDLAKEWAKYGKHFILAYGVNIVPYSQLSQKKNTGLLERLKPKAIICDEADALSDPKTATSDRFYRYLYENSIYHGGDCRLFAMSGTLGRKSIKDWHKLAYYALGPRSPLPHSYGALDTFALALDVRKPQRGMTLYESGDKVTPYTKAREVVSVFQSRFGGDNIREGYGNRLASCPGVVVSSNDGIDLECVVIPRAPEVPESISALYRQLEDEWMLPDGTLTEDPLELHRKLREISLGFWNRWVWPDNQPDTEWLAARQEWCAAVRSWQPRRGTGTDSKALVEDLCAQWLWHRHDPEKYKKPAYKISEECIKAYAVWATQKHKPTPPTEAVWVDYYSVMDAVIWARSQKAPVLIWAESEEWGYAVAKAGGFRMVGRGGDNHALLATMDAETIVISRQAHYRGKNLQDRWHLNYIGAIPSGGAIVEQQLGRCYRTGQKERQVEYVVCVQTSVLAASLATARRDSEFIEDTHKTRQILNHATFRRKVSIKATPRAKVDTHRVRQLPRSWGYDRASNSYAPLPIGYIRHPRDRDTVTQALATVRAA